MISESLKKSFLEVKENENTIYQNLWDTAKKKSPGPDGFSAEFY
jgi:hypothetical protein